MPSSMFTSTDSAYLQSLRRSGRIIMDSTLPGFGKVVIRCFMVPDGNAMG